jgi:uncharacterized protein (DUF427 family)
MSQAAARQQSGYAAHPGYAITFEPCAKRLRVMFNGETVADSTNVRLMHETKHIPVYYFPRADVRADLLTATDHGSHCPFKGDAAYWTVTAGDKTAENAVWSYTDPYDEVADIKDTMAFYWDRMDHWFEEDEEVFVHARDPYKRIDIVPSSRPVRVVLGGETVAASTQALFLYETGLPTRYYIPAGDVTPGLLEATDLATECPYKGRARYWSATVGGKTFEDIVWGYPDPVHESAAIKNHLCFFNEKVDAILVDGEEMPCPETPWS